MTVTKFNSIQMQEMENHRWIESQKAGRDLGEYAYIDWVKKHAKQFRDETITKQK